MGLALNRSEADFYIDLNFGKEAEEIVREVFGGRGTLVWCEVKRDTPAARTGNIYVEVDSWGKPSGISVTRADYWVVIIDHKVGLPSIHAEPMLRLKQFCDSGKYRLVNCKRAGCDCGGHGYLIPICDLISDAVWEALMESK